ncbi:hypothetical protein [Mucilaginibacter celer]|uniref:Glycosyltransferase n=1 Tax=Mucilaginibacter celer TaxID=2305508 RepID=A0A494VP79_9SPHI|nr:hypothetical protein [Mucilaginibacter celer]AYL97247.1 hypothetical protein HYN43_018875 [Mucilaginibacter celer]
MLRVNLVARIAGDKNSFPDLVKLAHQLKQQGVTDFLVTFIGAIEDQGIYQNIITIAEQLDVSHHIAFTGKSIPMAELSDELKSGYFLNFTVGSFMGYSSIDSINLGFKTIFCNCDAYLTGEQYDYINVCRNLDEVANLLLLINKDAGTVDKQIMTNNQLMKQSFLLTAAEASQLKNLMLPNG